MNGPTVSVVVCTCDRPAQLERCLRALREQAARPVEVVVADNFPSNPAARVLAMNMGARHLAVPVRGVSRVRNAGARACTTDLVAYIDDDMVPHPRWLESIVATFSATDASVVTGPVVPATHVRDSDETLASELEFSAWGARPFRVDKRSQQWCERAHFGGIGDGNMAFRRAAFASWRGFEELLGRGGAIPSGEEHYAFYELLAAGRAIAYCPEATVFHEEPPACLQTRLSRVREAAAYATFVMLRHPAHAWRILRFLANGAAGVRPAWRRGREQPVMATLPAIAAFRAFAAGALSCIGALARHGGDEPAPSPTRRIRQAPGR